MTGLSPCGLVQHQPGARVQWQQGLLVRHGKVLWHNPSTRSIGVLPDCSVEFGGEVGPEVLHCSGVGVERGGFR